MRTLRACFLYAIWITCAACMGVCIWVEWWWHSHPELPPMSLADSAVMFFLAVPLALAAGSAFGLRNRLVALIPLLIATFCGGYVGAALRLGILRDSIRYVENLPHSRDVRSCGPPAEFLMLCFEVYIFLPLMLVFAMWALASILLRRQSRNKW